MQFLLLVRFLLVPRAALTIDGAPENKSTCLIKQPLPDISNNADSCQALFEDTSFFLPERGFLFRFLSFSLFSASTTTARL
jgi:hypothetical protein